MPTRLLALLAAAAILLAAHAAPAQSSNGRGERTPYTDIRFLDRSGNEIVGGLGVQTLTAEILVDGVWRRWIALDGIPYERIAAAAMAAHGPEDWSRRVGEDLVHVLSLLGHEPGPTVDLTLAPAGGEAGEPQTLKNVPMTAANRALVRDRRAAREDRAAAAEAARPMMTRPVDAPALFRRLVDLVEQEHAYAHLRALDLRAEADRELNRLGEAPLWPDVVLAAQRFIARLGDGHASVHSWGDHAPPGALPFLLAEAEGGIVAFKPDRSGFVDERRPFVAAIDGLPIESWIAAAANYEAAGSPQLVRRRALELLRRINLVRAELDLPAAETIEVELRSAAGDPATLRLPVAPAASAYGVWPRALTSRVLPSGLGYLRILKMDLQRGGHGRGTIPDQLRPLLNAPGLVIDVRGNTGGARDVLMHIAPMLMEPGESRVVNIAFCRIPPWADPAYPRGYLEDRFLYPANWDGWSDAERAAIQHAAAAFKPEWQPPAGDFSEPHYCVITAPADGPRYAGPVVVLMDEACFSATDIFLSALKGLPNVTLVGLPSGGGSARSHTHELGALGFRVRLATMASYRPDGRLFDGRGIDPDIRVPRTPTDLLGRTDTQLAAAERLLLQKVTPAP